MKWIRGADHGGGRQLQRLLGPGPVRAAWCQPASRPPTAAALALGAGDLTCGQQGGPAAGTQAGLQQLGGLQEGLRCIHANGAQAWRSPARNQPEGPALLAHWQVGLEAHQIQSRPSRSSCAAAPRVGPAGSGAPRDREITQRGIPRADRGAAPSGMVSSPRRASLLDRRQPRKSVALLFEILELGLLLLPAGRRGRPQYCHGPSGS